MPRRDDSVSTAPHSPSTSAGRDDEQPLVELLESAQSKQPIEVIQHVHDNAAVQYRITKRLKQQEFAYKIAEAQRIGDRAKLKNEKKKVDNHASAVASRVKQEFLVSSFESLVRKTMRDSSRLALVVKRQESASATKDAEIRMMSRRISQLTKEVSDLNAHISMRNAVRNSSDVSARDAGGWISLDEFPLESHPAASESRFDDLSSQAMPCVQGQEGNPVIRQDGGSAVSTFVGSVNSYAQEHGSEFCKLDPLLWEPLPAAVVTERQVAFNARLKPDEHEEFFNPVA